MLVVPTWGWGWLDEKRDVRTNRADFLVWQEGLWSRFGGLVSSGTSVVLITVKRVASKTLWKEGFGEF